MVIIVVVMVILVMVVMVITVVIVVIVVIAVAIVTAFTYITQGLNTLYIYLGEPKYVTCLGSMASVIPSPRWPRPPPV